MEMMELLVEKECIKDYRSDAYEKLKLIDYLKNVKIPELQESLNQLSEQSSEVEKELKAAFERQDAELVGSLHTRNGEIKKELAEKKSDLDRAYSLIIREEKEYKKSLLEIEKLMAKWRKLLTPEEITALERSTCFPAFLFKEFLLKKLNKERRENGNFRRILPDEYCRLGHGEILDCHLSIFKGRAYLSDFDRDISNNGEVFIASCSDTSVKISNEFGGKVYEEEWIDFVSSRLSPTLKRVYARTLVKSYEKQAREITKGLKEKAAKYKALSERPLEFES